MIAVLAAGANPGQNLTLSEQIQAYGVMAVPGQAGPRRDDAGPTALAGRPARQPRRRWPTTRTSRPGSRPASRQRAWTCEPAEWLLMRAGILRRSAASSGCSSGPATWSSGSCSW